MRLVWLALLTIGLSGCSSYSLQELRQANPTGTEFQQALAQEYLLLASQEEANYDWQDAWYFADKGLKAAYGNDVGPEEPSDWKVDPALIPELEQARDDLLTSLRPEVVSAKPQLAARAYRYYDCWIERAEDGWETKKIEECKQNFAADLAELQQQSSQQTATSGNIDTASYLVFFEWNRSTLTTAAMSIIDEVSASLAGEINYEIILNGHTDTTGLERFNLKLSQQRAQIVANRLMQGGVIGDAIKIFAFGESDPKVPTLDNVEEPKNRRVEIFIE